MFELGAGVVFGLLAGAAVGRWWLVPVPLVMVAVWVVAAAAGGGEDADGVPEWQWALLFGVAVAAPVTLALSVGVILGRYARERRSASRYGNGQGDFAGTIGGRST